MAGNKAKRFLSFNHTTKTYHILQKHTTKTSSSIHCALTDNDMLIMVGKRVRGGICHEIHWDARTKENIWKIMIRRKNIHILHIGT